MTNYGKCKNCTYGEPVDGTWKWHCTLHGTMEDPDEVQECRGYRPRGSGGGCFLTTACCEHMGLSDDCYELETLRKFRDEYIRKQPYGNELINNYYRDAPIVVDAVNIQKNSDEIWESTYKEIQNIISVIEAGKTEEAVVYYMMLLYRLSKNVKTWKENELC